MKKPYQKLPVYSKEHNMMKDPLQLRNVTKQCT